MSISTSDDRGLAGQTFFVTGGGSGIGRGVAEALARAGGNLALLDRDGENLDEVAMHLKDTGVKITCHAADVADTDAVHAAVREAAKTHGGIDGAVNAAGILGPTAELGEYPADDYRRVLDVNIMGVVNSMKAQLAVMTKQEKGAIVNIASAAGIIGWANQSAYVASKHAVVGITKTAGLEYATRGIRINSVCPAFIYTNMTGALFETPGVEDIAIGLHPIGRLGQPQEVAEAAMWLLSDRSSFAVGSNLVLDGGSTVD